MASAMPAAVTPRSGAAASGPRMLECFNPATGERLGEVPIAGPEEIDRRIDRAREAQRSWGALSFRERQYYLFNLRAEIARSAEEIVEVICRDTGKVKPDAVGEVLIACDNLTWFAKKAAKCLRDEAVRPRLFPHKKAWKTYFPFGVVGVIAPWNFPFVLSMGPASAALAAGNAVILKPSEVTSWVGKKIQDLIERAEFPRDVFQVAFGYGDTGAALVSNPKIGKVTFTGSVATGKKVAMACAQNLTPVTLELGGKDPCLVLPDADLDRAAAGAVWGAFTNAGQVCQSVERVYVHKAIAEEFTRKVVEKTRALRMGTFEGPNDVGSMTFPRQVEIVEEHLKEAVDRGAKILAGGKRGGQGLFFEPTVLTNVQPDMKILREETFGPVLPIIPVDSEEEAVRQANDSVYGLCSSVWSRDIDRARKVAARIEAGAVNINDTMVNYAMSELPFGGVKHSGIGRVHGPEGLRNFANVRVVTANRFHTRTEQTWYPYDPKKIGFILKIIKFLFGRPGKL